MSDAVLEVRGVVKRYAGTCAIDEVNFALERGRVTALIGENGAGKSTLVKLLGGIETPTAGTLLMDGQPVTFRSIRDAEARGIGVIHQELNLCPNLSVTDNVFLARETRRRGVLVDRRAQRTRARQLLERLEHPIDPDATVGDLPLGQQQIVEIARALSRDVRVLMMDEPTSALSAAETGVLFRIIEEMAGRGVAVLYISHRLNELLTIADRVSVLRDGRLVAEAPAADVDASWIVERMTGRAAEEPHGHDQPPGGREVLRVDRLSVAEGRGRQWLRGVSFGVRAGEILGIYGLLGAGVTALLEAMAGVRPPSDGSIRFEGVSIDRLGPAERIELGIASVPEDRQVSGLVPTASVRANLCLSALGPLVRMFWISDIAERAAASGSVRALGIRASSLDQNVLSLSGGNQQKVVIGRALMTSPKVLLLDEPTRGVDIGAKAEIQALVRRLAAEGMAVVLGSSDLHDIRTTADRVLVLSRGLVTAEFSREKATDEALALAAGAAWAQEHAS